MSLIWLIKASSFLYSRHVWRIWFFLQINSKPRTRADPLCLQLLVKNQKRIHFQSLLTILVIWSKCCSFAHTMPYCSERNIFFFGEGTIPCQSHPNKGHWTSVAFYCYCFNFNFLLRQTIRTTSTAKFRRIKQKSPSARSNPPKEQSVCAPSNHFPFGMATEQQQQQQSIELRYREIPWNQAFLAILGSVRA